MIRAMFGPPALANSSAQRAKNFSSPEWRGGNQHARRLVASILERVHDAAAGHDANLQSWQQYLERWAEDER